MSEIEIRAAAIAHVQALTRKHGVLPHRVLAPGFTFRGENIRLHTMARGIFKPRQFRHLLSIKSVYPRLGRERWYADQLEAHSRFVDGAESVAYSFMGSDSNATPNNWLREAYRLRIPIIYFIGISPANYVAVTPTYVVGIDEESMCAQIAFGAEKDLKSAESGKIFENAAAFPESPEHRRYTLHDVKKRLHQKTFREAVLTAYDRRCAVSGVPEPDLLDAAHIVGDGDEDFGQPIVPNGLPLSKIHHAAFDSHLLGIDPDFRIHVAERLLTLHDGPMLELLKEHRGHFIRLPRFSEDRPDRDRLAIRFEQFLARD